MNRYSDASQVVLTVPFVDKNGNSVSTSTVAYRVLDEAGLEVVASTPIVLSGGEVETVITVLAADNTLPVDATRMMRVIELTMTDANGAIYVTQTRYVIEASSVLEVYGNTLITYDEAILIAMDIPNLDSWEAATDSQRQAALLDAYAALARLSYEVTDPRDPMDYLFPGSTSIDSIYDLAPADWALLPAQFVIDFSKAQVVEADSLLGGDDIADRRRRGLMSETIGESSMMFRPGKPLNLPVNQRTLRYLSGYVRQGIRLTRV